MTTLGDLKAMLVELGLDPDEVPNPGDAGEDEAKDGAELIDHSKQWPVKTLMWALNSLIDEKRAPAGSGWVYAYKMPFRVHNAMELGQVKPDNFCEEWVVIKVGITVKQPLAKRLYTQEVHPINELVGPGGDKPLDAGVYVRAPTDGADVDDAAYRTQLVDDDTDANRDLMFVVQSDTGAEAALGAVAGFPIGKCRKADDWADLFDGIRSLGPTELVLCRKSTFDNLKAKFHDGTLRTSAPALWADVRAAAAWDDLALVQKGGSRDHFRTPTKAATATCGGFTSLAAGSFTLVLKDADGDARAKGMVATWQQNGTIASQSADLRAKMYQHGLVDPSPTVVPDLADCQAQLRLKAAQRRKYVKP